MKMGVPPGCRGWGEWKERSPLCNSLRRLGGRQHWQQLSVQAEAGATGRKREDQWEQVVRLRRRVG